MSGVAAFKVQMLPDPTGNLAAQVRNWQAIRCSTRLPRMPKASLRTAIRPGSALAARRSRRSVRAIAWICTGLRPHVTAVI